MKLIVDSGSTKADWVAIQDNGNVIFDAHTLGINPEILEKEEILNRITSNSFILDNKDKVTHLYFYGAGCGTPRMKTVLYELFSTFFCNASVQVLEDTYAAVYATTTKGEKAIVSILGTGSNCSYFDGVRLHQKIESLGYIIMDDGSGNRFGRQLLRDFFFNKMPENLAIAFSQQYNLNADVIKQNLYKEPNPNAYLATFASFLIEHKNTAYSRQIIKQEMMSFVENNIMQFDDYAVIPVHFIGSIAYHLHQEIQEVFDTYSLTLGKIIQRPIEGLIAHHTLV